MNYKDLTDQKDALPFNRKEAFFTGTVFPMLMCSNSFAGLNKLVAHMAASDKSLEGLEIRAAEGKSNIQFFTEYDWYAASHTEKHRETWHASVSEETIPRNTPDIMFLVRHNDKKYLFAFEAKMFDAPGISELKAQMSEQAKILTHLERMLKVDEDLSSGEPSIITFNYAILPEKYLSEKTSSEVKHITWECLLELGKGQNTYFESALDYALKNYEKLTSKSRSGENSDGSLTGYQIFKAAEEYKVSSVGRGWGGMTGSLFQADIETGGWLTQKYQYSMSDNKGKTNWFPIKEFRKKILESLEAKQAVADGKNVDRSDA